MKAKEIIALIIMLIKDELESPDIADRFRIGKGFTRDRKLTFKAMVLFLLFKGKKALTSTMADFRDAFSDCLGSTGHITKQAVSKARKNLSPDIFRFFLRLCVNTFLDAKPEDSALEEKFHIFAIDGTDIQMPQRTQALEKFSFHKDRKGYPFAMGKGSILYSVTYKLIIDFQLQKYKFSERSLAMEHVKALSQVPFTKQPLIIMDRGYFSKELCAFMEEHGIKYIFRVKKNMLEVQKMIKSGSMDRVFPYKRNEKYHVTVRVIRLDLGDQAGEEYLVTNLFDSSIGLKEFKKLYFLRWPVELKYREIKGIECLEDFSGYTPEAIEQDCLITCLYSNLASILRMEADDYINARCLEKAAELEASKDTASGRKVIMYRSKICRSLERIMKRFPVMLAGLHDIEICCADIIAFLFLRENWSEIQPGRQYERVIKQPNRKYHYNKKSIFG